MSNTNTNVSIKPETRNHQGFFVRDGQYQLMGVDESGWALICFDDVSCHYVDPDNLESVEDLVD